MAPRARNIWKVVLGLVTLAVIVLAFVGYRYRAHVHSAYGWLVDETGGKTMALLSIALGLWLAVCALFWLLFPILAWLAVHRLLRRLDRIEQSVNGLESSGVHTKTID